MGESARAGSDKLIWTPTRCSVMPPVAFVIHGGIAMLRRYYLATTLVAAIGTASAVSQPAGAPPKGPTGYDIPLPKSSSSRPLGDPKPVFKYELKPEHGEYLLIVKTFQGKVAGDDRGEAKAMAERLAEYIRSECRLYAYVHESGWAKRQQQDKEKVAVIAAAQKHYRAKGWKEDEIDNEIKKIVRFARIPDEYSVLIAPGKGTLKNIDEALEFAKYVRKLDAPPADFCEVSSAGVVSTEKDPPGRKGELQNPFLHVMPGRNPTIPKKEVGMQRPKADDFLMSLNAGKPYSLIHKTKKDFTLVVQVYGTKFGQFQRPGDVVPASVKSDGELLERAAQQAELVAKVLRQQNPPYDAYVLHTRYESFVCVGEYDSKDDPALLANASALAKWQLRKEGKTGEVLDTFMEKPLPAMIPRP